jgi:acyl-CoA thioesterase FadM
VAETGKSRLAFESEIVRDRQVLALGRVVLACLDRAGKPRRLNEELLRACAPA